MKMRAAAAVAVAGMLGAIGCERSLRADPRVDRYLAYVGTYTGGASGGKGVYRYAFDPATGKLSEVGVTGGIVNPSFLAISPDGARLYAVSEVENADGKKAGGVVGFAIDAADGSLTRINHALSGGGGPCHVAVDATGRCVMVANYGGGSVSAIGVDADGKLGEPRTVQHAGSGANPARQKGPHAHAVVVDAGNRFVVAADLGLDKLLVYRLDPAAATLTPAGEVATAPGAGPRHFAFHPSGRFALANHELDSTVTAYRYEAATGKLTATNTVTTLPADFAGSNSTAEIAVHPSGKVVYVSNRGHDSIAIFRFDESTGTITPVAPGGHQPTGGSTPRYFGLDPTGRWLLAANQKSDTITVFRVEGEKLEPTGQTISVPSPVCIQFVAWPTE